MALASILAASTAIYLLGKLRAPNPPKNGEKLSTYACGERTRLGRLAIDLTLCKYLIYFMILDSSMLIMAFASLELNHGGFIAFMIYISMILLATLLLAFGED